MIECESIDFDVVFIGGGPASLSGALHLSHLIAQHNKNIDNAVIRGKRLDESRIAVIEKGSEIGMHSLSGAVMDPRGLEELIPDFEEKGFPYEKKVAEDAIYFFTENRAFSVPFIPSALKNKGYYITSLHKLVRWMAGLAEEKGVNIFPSFPGVSMLYDGDRVTGVRTGDKGVNSEGKPKSNFEPGVDIKAKVTVLGEGARGNLTKELTNRFSMQGRNPQIYSTGVKEIWELPDPGLSDGRVIHTIAYPLDNDTFGGGFIYAMDNNLLSIGFVVGLDYNDPCTDTHEYLQRFKTHPFVSTLLKGGKVVHYGSKTIPEGGWFSMPQLYAAGCLIIGDSGSFLNAQRLKGIHLAVKSGMLAAETIFDALIKDDFSYEQMRQFQCKVDKSWIKTELYRARGFRQSFKKGLYSGMIRSGMQMTFGINTTLSLECGEDHTHMKTIKEYYGSKVMRGKDPCDGEFTFDKNTDLFYSGTTHEKDQPCHLLISDYDICNNRCKEEFGNPCQHFCPANVYEMVDDSGSGVSTLRVNAENCVHCKTCDIADPYGIITWVPPEGGGPKYINT